MPGCVQVDEGTGAERTGSDYDATGNYIYLPTAN